LVWDDFIDRNYINDWIKSEWQKKEESEDEELDDVDLEEYYEELKEEFTKLEKKKIKIFLDWNYDELDIINDEILNLTVKLDKISKLIWVEY
jgi:hypothetical protein